MLYETPRFLYETAHLIPVEGKPCRSVAVFRWFLTGGDRKGIRSSGGKFPSFFHLFKCPQIVVFVAVIVEDIERDFHLGVQTWAGHEIVHLLTVVDTEFLGSVVAVLPVVEFEDVRPVTLFLQCFHGLSEVPTDGFPIAVEEERIATADKHTVMGIRHGAQMVGLWWSVMQPARSQSNQSKE